MAFEREVEVAKLLAEEAGALALDYQRRGVTAEEKSDESPVTAADRACEKLIVERLAQEFPEDGILGEEGANREGTSGRRWIIDPIDGTRDFVRGIPLWAVLIGLEQEEGEVVVGAAYCPRQNLLLHANQGGGTWANGTRVQVSKETDFSKAVICFNGLHKGGARQFSPKLLDWLGHSWAVRGLGGAMDAMMVAQGKADIWIEPSASPWDFAALKILIEEAGGFFASFEGKDSIYEGNAFACAPGLRPYVEDLLSSAIILAK
jgi:histidinol-phosphatase